jgi:glycerol uptake facilitator-like aquaporin
MNMNPSLVVQQFCAQIQCGIRFEKKCHWFNMPIIPSIDFKAILAEALLTAFLVQTILNAAVEHPANPLAPLAIGSTVLVDIIGW